jgi:hypothetical protein
MDAFIDTRLYVSVRPRLEYVIPQYVRDAIAVLVEDKGLDELTMEPDPLPDVGDAPHDDALTDLYSACDRVVPLVEEHVLHVETSFTEFFLHTVRTFGHEMAGLRTLVEEARLGKAECYATMASLRRRLDETLHRYRTLPLPRIERSLELAAAARDLRQTFSAAYGRARTQHILHAKHCFERNVHAVQVPVGERLTRRVEEALRGGQM